MWNASQINSPFSNNLSDKFTILTYKDSNSGTWEIHSLWNLCHSILTILQRISCKFEHNSTKYDWVKTDIPYNLFPAGQIFKAGIRETAPLAAAKTKIFLSQQLTVLIAEICVVSVWGLNQEVNSSLVKPEALRYLFRNCHNYFSLM